MALRRAVTWWTALPRASASAVPYLMSGSLQGQVTHGLVLAATTGEHRRPLEGRRPCRALRLVPRWQ
jgi:hypothetical protein